MRHHWIFIGLLLTSISAAETSPSLPPAPSPQSDRKESSGSAAAMAIVGAAVAGAQCLMLRQMALTEINPQQRQMYRMMAMQQCAQAAMNAISAAKNKKSKDALTSPPEAKPKKPKRASPTAASSPKASPPGSSAGDSEAPSEPVDTAEALPDPEAAPEAASEEIPSESPPMEEVGEDYAAEVERTSIPGRIDRSRLGYEEKGEKNFNVDPPKSSSEPASPERSEFSASMSFAGNSIALQRHPASRSGSGGEAPASPGPAADAAGTEGSEAMGSLDDLISKLMGTQVAEATEKPNGGDLIFIGPKKSLKDDAANIFEFAGLVYLDLIRREQVNITRPR